MGGGQGKIEDRVGTRGETGLPGNHGRDQLQGKEISCDGRKDHRREDSLHAGRRTLREERSCPVLRPYPGARHRGGNTPWHSAQAMEGHAQPLNGPTHRQVKNPSIPLCLLAYPSQPGGQGGYKFCRRADFHGDDPSVPEATKMLLVPRYKTISPPTDS